VQGTETLTEDDVVDVHGKTCDTGVLKYKAVLYLAERTISEDQILVLEADWMSLEFGTPAFGYHCKLCILMYDVHFAENTKHVRL
jgi:hypothetical protein